MATPSKEEYKIEINALAETLGVKVDLEGLDAKALKAKLAELKTPVKVEEYVISVRSLCLPTGIKAKGEAFHISMVNGDKDHMQDMIKNKLIKLKG